MDFTELVQTRRSVRTFSDAEIDEATIENIIECARLAPSWKNRQCWHFIIIRDKDKINEIVASGMVLGNSWLENAPALIVACGNPAESGDRYGIPYYAVDVAIALEHIMLAATEKGLGTCWVGIFDNVKLKAALEIPDAIEIVALTPLGYPADNMSVQERLTKSIDRTEHRKPLSDIIHWEKFPVV